MVHGGRLQYNLGVLISVVKVVNRGRFLRNYSSWLPMFSHVKLRRRNSPHGDLQGDFRRFWVNPCVSGVDVAPRNPHISWFQMQQLRWRIGTLKEVKIEFFKESTRSLQSVSRTCACSHLKPLIVFHWDLDAQHGWMNWRCIIFSAWWPFWIFLASYNPTTRLMRNSR